MFPQLYLLKVYCERYHHSCTGFHIGCNEVSTEISSKELSSSESKMPSMTGTHEGSINEPQWRVKAMQKIGEVDSKKVEKDIETLREMVLAETNLYVRTDDDYLLKFLRVCGFNCAEAFALVIRLFEKKFEFPYWFPSQSFSDFERLVSARVMYALGERDHKGRKILMVDFGSRGADGWPRSHVVSAYQSNLTMCIQTSSLKRTKIVHVICKLEQNVPHVTTDRANLDPSKISFDEVATLTNINGHAISLEPDSQRCGLVLIVNAQNYRWQYLKWAMPQRVLAVCEMSEKCYPLRLEALHVVFEPFLFGALVNVTFPLLSSRLRSLVHFHGSNLKSLHQHFSPSILPEIFGGSRGKNDEEEWINTLYSNFEELKESASYGFRNS